MNSSLETLIGRLNTHKGKFPQIAREAEVGLDWLRRLARGDFNDIGVERYEKLLAWLDAQEGAEAV